MELAVTDLMVTVTCSVDIPVLVSLLPGLPPLPRIVF